MSPLNERDTLVLDTVPTTELERNLQEALCASNMIVDVQKRVMQGMQAQTTLHSMYLESVRGQLQAQEEKKLKKRKTGKINMHSQAKILMQLDIIAGVKEWQDSQDKVVEEAAVKKKAKEKYNEAMDIWKVHEMDRKGQNADLKSGWDEDVKKWTIEQDYAKYDHCKPRWMKPKMPTMEKALCKPMVADFNPEDESSKEDEQDLDQMLIDNDLGSN
ncbi:hypothetical protein L208DRAFT_1328312 [Tricholoma matsutake]|nr:hypothetical protein L208DRAFT_1328312 [Tricholoma matsutake 945]